MTVPTETCDASFAYTGAETTFNAGYRAKDRADVRAKFTDAFDTETVLVLDTHYSVALDVNEVATLTKISFPAAAGTLYTWRVTPATNDVDFDDLDNFPKSVHTEIADRGAMRDAEARRDLAPALQAAEDIADAAAYAAAAAASAAKLVGTSTSTVAISDNGAKDFVTQAGKQFNPGQYALAVDADNPLTKQIFGKIAAYVDNALQITSQYAVGSGSVSNWIIYVAGAQGAIGPAGPAAIPKKVVRARTTANVNLASGLANGTTHDGVTVATGELVFVAAQSAPAENGIYTVPAAGAASRHGDFDTWAEIVDGGPIAVQEGTAHADTLWQFTANAGGTLNTTAITFKAVNPLATETSAGLIEKATSAEAIAGSDTDRAVTPAGLKAALRANTEVFMFALSDEASDLIVGAAKVTWRAPYALENVTLRGSVNTAPTGATIIVDVNKNGATMMTTNKLSIDASEKTSVTAATPVAMTTTTLADDDEVTMDIDQIGSAIKGKGLKVYLYGNRPNP